MGRGRDDKGGLIMCGAGCCAVLYLASIIMVACSFDTLEPLDAGIEYNTATKGINADQVYTSGRYFLGLGKAFLRFPRNYLNIEFSNSASADEPPLVMERTQVTVECSLQYTLSLDNLTTIYANNALNYHDKMVKEATNAIKNVASDWEAQKFYQDRRAAAAEMMAAARAALATQNGELRDFQLRKVTLKAQNEADVIRKMVTAEAQRTARNDQLRNEITAQTTVIAGEQDRLIAIFQANKTREANIITQQADATAKAVELNGQSSAFAVLKNGLGFSQPELLKYLWLQQLRTLDASTKLVVGFEDATIKVT